MVGEGDTKAGADPITTEVSAITMRGRGIPLRTSSTEGCQEAEAVEETGSARVLFAGQQDT